MAAYAHPDAIVSTAWLAANLGDPSLRIFDCTTYLLYESGTGRPYTIKSGREDYDAGHIPGAGFLICRVSFLIGPAVSTSPCRRRMIWRHGSRHVASVMARALSFILARHRNGQRAFGG